LKTPGEITGERTAVKNSPFVSEVIETGTWPSLHHFSEKNGLVLPEKTLSYPHFLIPDMSPPPKKPYQALCSFDPYQPYQPTNHTNHTNHTNQPTTIIPTIPTPK